MQAYILCLLALLLRKNVEIFNARHEGSQEWVQHVAATCDHTMELIKLTIFTMQRIFYLAIFTNSNISDVHVH